MISGVDERKVILDYISVQRKVREMIVGVNTYNEGGIGVDDHSLVMKTLRE